MKEFNEQDNFEKKDDNPTNIGRDVKLETDINEVSSEVIEAESKSIEILDFKTLLEISPNFYAGFFSRYIAFTIDIIVVFCISALVNTVTFGVLDMQLPVEIIVANNVLLVLTYILYFVLMTFFFGQTLGKMMMKIKIEKNKGGRLTFSDVVFREIVGRFINNTLFFLPYLSILFNNKKKGLHDFIADSVVVKEDFQSIRQKLNDKLSEKDR